MMNYYCWKQNFNIYDSREMDGAEKKRPLKVTNFQMETWSIIGETNI